MNDIAFISLSLLIFAGLLAALRGYEEM